MDPVLQELDQGALMRLLLLLVALLSYGASAQVEARLRVDNPLDRQWARLVVLVHNGGTQDLQNPTAVYDLDVPQGKVPVVENWYVGQVSTSVRLVEGTKWELRLSLTGTLSAGMGWNSNQGAQVGVHLSDWSVWDHTLSPSFDGNTGTMVSNRKIRVFDGSGQLVWGESDDLAPPPSPTGSSSVTVIAGVGGRCNATGTVSLKSTDRLELRCQERRTHLPAEIWLDGTLQPRRSAMDITPDGLDHRVEVRFPARATLIHTVEVLGPGACVPSPVVVSWQGIDEVVACAADNGAVLASLKVDGINVPPSMRVNLDGGASRSLQATFEARATSQNLAVEAFKEFHSDPSYSVYRVRIRNLGTAPVAAGWTAQIPVRIPDNVSLSLNPWDMPGAVLSQRSLGDGWVELTLTGQASIAPGAISGDGRGAYFGLRINHNSFRWDVTGDVAIPAGPSWQDAPWIRVYSSTGALLAGKEYVMEQPRSGAVSVEVRYKDEGLSANIIRPRVILKNLSNLAISDFTYDYHFCTEGGKFPILEPWYEVSPRVWIEALGGHCYKIRYQFLGVTLAPGAELPGPSGNVVGVHFGDWSSWDRSNDWSSTNTTSQFQVTNRIPVYDKWGNLIGGEDPYPPTDGEDDPSNGGEFELDPTPPIILEQPRDVTVLVGESASFEVRASADGELRYQWRENGQNLPNETGSVLRVEEARLESDGHIFEVRVEGPGGWVVSRRAKLNVRQPPPILQFEVQPFDAQVHPGSTARFEVRAVGEGILRYQWYRGAKPLAKEKSPILTLPNITPEDAKFSYWVRVWDSKGRSLDSRKAAIVLSVGKEKRLELPIVGRFLRQDLAPVDTSIDLVLRLFDRASGGRQVWSEEHWDVPVVSGHWSVLMGRSAVQAELARQLAILQTVYLEVVLDATTSKVFQPRIPLGAAPFAFEAGVRVIFGSGSPQADLPKGTFYFDQSSEKTWFHDATGWRAIEP